MNDDKGIRCNSKFRLWSKMITSIRNEIRNSAYPARIEILWILIALVTGLHFTEGNSDYDLIKYLTGFSAIAK